jgi:hypothetical protein
MAFNIKLIGISPGSQPGAWAGVASEFGNHLMYAVIWREATIPAQAPKLSFLATPIYALQCLISPPLVVHLDNGAAVFYIAAVLMAKDADTFIPIRSLILYVTYEAF